VTEASANGAGDALMPGPHRDHADRKSGILRAENESVVFRANMGQLDFTSQYG
jgi:hypothetical protein